MEKILISSIVFIFLGCTNTVEKKSFTSVKFPKFYKHTVPGVTYFNKEFRGLSSSKDNGDLCDTKNIFSIPTDDGKNIKYKKISNKNIKSGVDFIFLQGGPGLSIIQRKEVFENFNPSRKFYMDLRGTHCNKDVSNKISSLQFTIDWLEIAKKEKIQKVLIYGASYGTVLSVQVASLFEKNDIEVVGVIQDSTVGSFKKFPHLANNFLSVWKWHVDNILGASYFDEIKKNNPYGFSKNDFTKIALYASLLGGYYYSDSADINFLSQSLLSLVDTNTSSQDKEYYLDWFKTEIIQNVFFDTNDVYRQINCEEINPSGLEYQHRIDDQGNLIIDENKSYCPDMRKNESLFQVESYKFSSDILFLQGNLDPNTPLYGALDQARSLINNKRQILTTNFAGHGVLDKYLKKCSHLILNAYMNKKIVDSKVLKSCMAELKLYDLSPGVIAENNNNFFQSTLRFYDSKE